MRWHTGESRKRDASLPKVRNGEEESESVVEQERELEEFSCGDDEVEGKLAYGFLCNSKNTIESAPSAKEGKQKAPGGRVRSNA